MTRRLAVVAAAVLLAAVGCRRSGWAPPGRQAEAAKLYRVTIKDVPLLVEVAATTGERERGLMYRQELPAGTGMLFLYPDDRRRNFWMKNTPVPLSIAFIDGSGQITQIEDMVPLSEEGHISTEPVRAALEVPRGWFRDVGVQVGDRLTFGEALRKAFPSLVPTGPVGGHSLGGPTPRRNSRSPGNHSSPRHTIFLRG